MRFTNRADIRTIDCAVPYRVRKLVNAKDKNNWQKASPHKCMVLQTNLSSRGRTASSMTCVFHMNRLAPIPEGNLFN